MKATALILVLSLLSTTFSFAQETVPVSTVFSQSPLKVEKKLSLELFNYSERIYSRSKKTELGDELVLKSRFRYQFTDNAWTSLGFTTNPSENRFDNKTSDFEVRAGYVYKNLVLQLDLSLNTNDDDGGITIGPDVDSKNTFLSYKPHQNFNLIFYPFDFNSRTGVNIANFSVTRIYFIDGAPNQLNTLQLRDEKLANKTLPGFELNYLNFDKEGRGMSYYIGASAATYLFPKDPTFDIRQNTGALIWERKENIGYKAGAVYKNTNNFLSLQYVGQSEDEETGTLLQSAGNFYVLSQSLNKIIFEMEMAYSKSGSKPYRVDRRNNWFEVNENISLDPRQRVYSDRSNNIQDWVGKSGYAANLSVGLPSKFNKRTDFTPYLGFSYYSKYFVQDDYNGLSVHNLRNKNETLGHGGLNVLSLGAYFYPGNFIIHPRFDYLKAKNAVFTNSNDIRNDSISADFNSYDFQFFINVSYFYNKRTGPKTFRLN